MSAMVDREHTTADPFADRPHAAAWAPQPGERLTGRIEGFATYDAGWGRYPILVIKPDDGEPVAVHAQRQVLSRELAKLQPVAGEPIAIRYDGQVERSDGSGSYHRYTVRMPDRPVLLESLDWTPWNAEGAER